ncbi:hypothetical protein H8959_005580 [Pygathrix nigripes]
MGPTTLSRERTCNKTVLSASCPGDSSYGSLCVLVRQHLPLLCVSGLPPRPANPHADSFGPDVKEPLLQAGSEAVSGQCSPVDASEPQF